MEKRIIKYNKKNLLKQKSSDSTRSLKIVNDQNIHRRIGSHLMMNQSQKLV